MFSRAREYRPGDPVVYRVAKRSASPGPRAEGIDPEPRGEDYSYEVDKYWTVCEIRQDGQIVVMTRRGKTHLVKPDDRRLRHATLAERLIKARRFPQLQQLEAG